MTCDDQPLLDWKGAPASITHDPYWKTPNADRLYLGVYNSAYKFHQVELTPHISAEPSIKAPQ